MPHMKKEDEALLKELIISRNLSNSSKTAYKDTIQLYTELQGKSLKKLLI